MTFGQSGVILPASFDSGFFFFVILQVRASADLVETEASSAMVSLVMKLSELELRPLFLHLCEWKAAVAAEDGSKEATLGGLDRRLSFYRVLDGLSAALKVRGKGT